MWLALPAAATFVASFDCETSPGGGGVGVSHPQPLSLSWTGAGGDVASLDCSFVTGAVASWEVALATSAAWSCDTAACPAGPCPLDDAASAAWSWVTAWSVTLRLAAEASLLASLDCVTSPTLAPGDSKATGTLRFT